MLLVYTNKVTPRLRFTFKHLIKNILDVPVSFTNTIEKFIAHNSLKMSYAKQPLGNEIFIRSHELLFENGLSDLTINVQDWEDTKGFFLANEKSALSYDIFAASFYLLSRYEEYLPHVNDDYGRFLASESLAFKHGFLDQPIIDIWAYKFKKVLQKRFDNYRFPTRTYKVKPVIDVPMAYYFTNKGLLRTFGGSLGDLSRFKLKQFYQRYLALMGFTRDPYDTFKWIITKQKKHKSKFLVFFLVGDYSTYDKNISTNKKQFVSLIKSVSDYCQIGLKASFLALTDQAILKMEKRRLEGIVNTEVNATRNSHSKVNLPESYRNLVDLEIKEDYTMGYINELGFRAGTCTPFQFYDLDYEIETPLTVNSFHCFDFALLKHKSQLDKKETLLKLIESVKKVNGTFVPLFHNYSFAANDRWQGFKELFSLTLDSVHEE